MLTNCLCTWIPSYYQYHKYRKVTLQIESCNMYFLLRKLKLLHPFVSDFSWDILGGRDRGCGRHTTIQSLMCSADWPEWKGEIVHRLKFMKIVLLRKILEMAKKLPSHIIEIHGHFPLKILDFNFKMLINVYDHVKKMQMNCLMNLRYLLQVKEITKHFKMTPKCLCLDN